MDDVSEHIKNWANSSKLIEEYKERLPILASELVKVVDEVKLGKKMFNLCVKNSERTDLYYINRIKLRALINELKQIDETLGF